MSESKLFLPPVDRLQSWLAQSGLLDPAADVHIARAPGRLDVMGGIADYTGSRVCQMPLAIAAAAAVQKRNDGQLVCHSRQIGRSCVIPIARLRQARASELQQQIAGDDRWARYLAGCLWWLIQYNPSLPCDGGVTIVMDSDVPLGGGVSSSAAIEVATMSALASLYGVQLTPMPLAAACQQVENQIVGAPCGVMDQVASCMGQAESMLHILCQPAVDGSPAQLVDSIKVPIGYRFVGIHSGVRHEVSGDPYTDTRVAAFMAHKIIFSHLKQDEPSRHLANLPLNQYEQSLRALLPVAITGQAFLDRWGSSHDRVTTIHPSRTYRVQAAADHHVHEMHRVTRFIELLSSSSLNESHIRAAGLLMNESHVSYSDNANQGHELTDLLASLLQQPGPHGGIFGQRITGGGCGGTLAVLIRDEPQVHLKIDEVRRQYELTTGRTTQIFTGSSDGAAAWGVFVRRGN